MTSPIRNTLGFSAKCNVAITAMIAILLAVSSPSTILRAIMTVVVNPIQRVFGRGLVAHVGKEILKRYPLRADCYSASTVMMKTPILGISTSLNHVSPCTVFRAVCMSMRGHGVAPQTAARLCLPLKQMVFVNLGTVAAFTKTNPKLSIYNSDRRQSPVWLVESGCRYGIFKGHRLISFNRWLVGDVPLGAQIVAAALL